MPNNTQKITKEFCDTFTKSGNKLYFPVSTEEDVRKVQDVFFSFGYSWWQTGTAYRDAKKCLENGGIYLDSDTTLMHGTYSDGKYSWLCNIDQLDPKALSPEHAAMMEGFAEMKKEMLAEIRALRAEVKQLKDRIDPPTDKIVRFPPNHRP